MSKERRVVAEGKTKKLWGISRDEADVESNDFVTAGDGVKRHRIEGKGILANTTTCNCFELLRRAGIRTHYRGKIDDRTFRAQLLDMVPIELVVRRIATGSYLKRNLDVSEGTRFESPVIEFFYKDDEQHDPLMIPDFVGDRILYFDPKQPMASGYLKEGPLSAIEIDLYKEIRQLTTTAFHTFLLLEQAWATQNVVLVDLKIECGYDHRFNSGCRVADVVDNDSWRIRKNGEKSQEMSKQVYRDTENPSPEELEAIRKNYAWVAEKTALFSAIKVK